MQIPQERIDEDQLRDNLVCFHLLDPRKEKILRIPEFFTFNLKLLSRQTPEMLPTRMRPHC